MKPRYEIHSLSLSSAIEPVEGRRGDQQDRSAGGSPRSFLGNRDG